MDSGSSAKKRLFTGIPIPGSLIETFRLFRHENSGIDGLRWIPDNNLHITLVFIGDTPQKKLPELITKLADEICQIPAFHIRFEKFHLVKHGREPVMFWAQFEKNVAFDMLVKKTASVFPGSEKKIHRDNIPHATLARIKSHFQDNAVKYPDVIPDIRVNMNRCILWESRLSSEGSNYFPLMEFHLADSKKV
ncbi:MAG: RNA 2',3'-cyclic phosphodiesterase [Bacteroidetes bacterium]|nr:RNA 2',3'-cyclic phosphodiesterase [Bacteroidota bacterium]